MPTFTKSVEQLNIFHLKKIDLHISPSFRLGHPCLMPETIAEKYILLLLDKLYYFKIFVTTCELALTSNILCTCLILIEYVQYGFRSDVTKFEPDLTCLATVRAQSVNIHMFNNFGFDLTADLPPVTSSVTSRSTK